MPMRTGVSPRAEMMKGDATWSALMAAPALRIDRRRTESDRCPAFMKTSLKYCWWFFAGPCRPFLRVFRAPSRLSTPKLGAPAGPALAAGAERSGKAAQAGDHAQRRETAGARVLGRGNILNGHGKSRTVGVDLDEVCVAVESRIGPDLQPRALGADAGQRQRRRDIDILGEAARAVARRAVEHLERGGELLERDAMFGQVGRAGEPVRRPARRHFDAADLTLGGGAHRVEAEERAGWDDDAGTRFACPLDEIG